MTPRVTLKIKGKSSGGKGSKGKEEKSTSQCLKEWSTWIMKKVKVATHYGCIPLVIVIGMNSEPKPHLYLLLAAIQIVVCLPLWVGAYLLNLLEGMLVMIVYGLCASFLLSMVFSFEFRSP